MMPQWEHAAQTLIAACLNSIPEGILLVSLVWLILRFLPRQNSRTRFALWFLVLMAVVALPFIRTLSGAGAVAASANQTQAFLNLPDEWALILLATWLLAACLAMLRLGVGVFRLASLLRSCVDIREAELDPAIRSMIEHFCSSRSVAVALSEQLNVPAAVGFLNPVIVVPGWALRELTPQQLEIILLHEYAHIERCDGWTNLLQKTLRAMFCFHPAVWWIENRLSLEREMACDDYVLAQTNDPHGYGRCLIALLERTLPRKALAMAQAAVHRTHEAMQRLSQILDKDRATTRRIWKPALATVGAVSLLSLVLLPQTRQLVGFAPNNQPTSRDAAVLPVTPASPIVSAAVVPAALHSSQFPIEKKLGQKTSDSRRPTRPAERRASDSTLLSAGINSQPVPLDVLPIVADEPIVPVAETVLVIRTANQIGPNSWRWTVAVWRVSLVPEQSHKVPAFSNKT